MEENKMEESRMKKISRFVLILGILLCARGLVGTIYMFKSGIGDLLKYDLWSGIGMILDVLLWWFAGVGLIYCYNQLLDYDAGIELKLKDLTTHRRQINEINKKLAELQKDVLEITPKKKRKE